MAFTVTPVQGGTTSSSNQVNDPGIAGAYVVLAVNSDWAGNTISAPTGGSDWDEVYHDDLNVDGGTTSVWTCPSSPGSGAITFAAGDFPGEVRIIGFYIQGHDTTTPLHKQNHTVHDTADSEPVSAVCPSVTTTIANCLLLAFAEFDTTNNNTCSYTNPSGYSAGNNMGADTTWCQLASAYMTQSGSGATGTATFIADFAGSGEQAGWVGVLLAIAPAGGAAAASGPPFAAIRNQRNVLLRM